MRHLSNNSGSIGLLMLTLIAISCSESGQDIIFPRPQPTINLSEAKAWYNSNLVLSRSNDRNSGAVIPKWDKVTISSNVAEMPFTVDGKLQLPSSKFWPKHQGRKRLLVHKGKVGFSAHIISYIPSDKFTGDIKKVNVGNFKMMKFDGEIKLLDIASNRMKIISYSFGAVTNSFMAHRPSSKTKSNGRTQDCYYESTQDCVDWFQSVNGGELEYLDTTCDPWETEFLFCDTEPISNYYDPYDCTYNNWPWCDSGSGGGSSGVASRLDIIRDSVYNHIENPCLREMVTKAVYENIDNRISHIINQVFENSELFDLSFHEVTDLSSTDLGEAMVSHLNNGRVLADIFLNVNVLSNSSQEMIIATIFHEVLHAYLGYSRNSQLFNDHEEMASEYINLMKDSLLNLFPSMSEEDAEALAWGGLHETSAWQHLVDSNPTNSNEITQTNINHANGTKGTDCQ